MDDATVERLKKRTLEVFPYAVPPSFDEIIFHRCVECDGVRDDINGVEWWNASDELIYSNFDKLPLFTPKAYQYYLPAYIFSALVPRDHDTVMEYLVYSWSPSSDPSRKFLAQRRAILRAGQQELVKEILRAVIGDESLVYHHNDAERGLRFYSEKEK